MREERKKIVVPDLGGQGRLQARKKGGKERKKKRSSR